MVNDRQCSKAYGMRSCLYTLLSPTYNCGLGPIVRLTPYEVHIDDPAFFNELYSMTKKLHKDPWYYSWLDRNGSIFATMDPDLHKLRSGPVKKGLSPASISRVEEVLKGHLRTFIQRLRECRDENA